MEDFTVVIPARYGSTRLPGKPLLPLGGRTLIEHVWQRAIDSGASRVMVATDDKRIADHVRGFGGTCCMTGAGHESGTARIAEVVTGLAIDRGTIVVNLQGDEPLMPSAVVAQVAATLAATPAASVATLATPLQDSDEIHDPHAVKLVTDHRGRALYFSRAAIPWDREGQGARMQATARRHLGIYAYRAGFLHDYPSLPPSPLETLEQLEQLRALQAGAHIQVADAVARPGPGIDTPADLAVAEAAMHVQPASGGS
jgi:3-deoxy-manno-octulosonate cytidylyltransferase (CMP-KDO synthetase)